MTNYREILRLHSRGISQRGIAASCQCSRNTVVLSISEMGHFLNRTLWHDQAALISSLRPRL